MLGQATPIACMLCKQGPDGIADRAESLRREGKLKEAGSLIETCLELNPVHPRALLLKGRILYEQERLSEALDALGLLDSIRGGDAGIKVVVQTLRELSERRGFEADRAFATESMAALLAEQGYFLEAMDIYRQLFMSSRETRYLEGILRVKERLEAEGSRGRAKEKIAGELKAWERWIEKRRRGL